MPDPIGTGRRPSPGEGRPPTPLGELLRSWMIVELALGGILFVLVVSLTALVATGWNRVPGLLMLAVIVLAGVGEWRKRRVSDD